MNKKILFTALASIGLLFFTAVFLQANASWESQCAASGGSVVSVGGRIGCSWDGGATASWQTSAIGGSTTYGSSAGILGSGTFLPPPGCSSHRAQTPDGLSSSATSCFDPINPYLASPRKLVSAGHQKTTFIRFGDLYQGAGLSGVRGTTITVSGPTGTATYSPACSSVECDATFTHDFSKIGLYDLSWSATDAVGNTASGQSADFFQVVAGPPEWDDDNCYRSGGSKVNYETTCPSTIEISPDDGEGNARVANGSDEYTVDIHLADRYGNRIIPVKDVKNVDLLFHFDNTVDLNQVSKYGDAAEFLIPELGLDEIGADSGDSHITEIGWVTEAPVLNPWSPDSEINAGCGGANGQSFDQSPAISNPEFLCASGSSASAVTTDSVNWFWSCSSDTNSTSADCSANVVVNGVCGTADGQAFGVKPTTNLCLSSAVDPVVGGGIGSWIWACLGEGGGSSEICETQSSGLVADQIVELSAQNPGNYDSLGASIAISNGIIAAGAPRYGDKGAVYIFDGSGNQTIIQPDGLAEKSFFGEAIELDGDNLIVGSRGENENAGAVYIFNKNDQSWELKNKLTVADGGSFGLSVDISGGRAIAGNQDSSFIINLAEDNWSVGQKITSDSSDDRFGNSVGIDGNYAIVGAPNDDEIKSNSGAAYIFENSGGTWREIKKLISPDSSRTEYSSDSFGISVDISGGTAVIGMPNEDFDFLGDSKANVGAAYVAESSNDWEITKRLNPFDSERYDYFGSSVVIKDNYIIIGKPGSNEDANDLGAVYIFEKTNDGWIQASKLIAPNSEEWDKLGTSVNIDATGQAVAGAPARQTYQGVVYSFSGWEK